MSIRGLHLAVTSRSVVSYLIMLSEEIENNDIKSSPDETSTMPNKCFVSSHKIACCFKSDHLILHTPVKSMSPALIVEVCVA